VVLLESILDFMTGCLSDFANKKTAEIWFSFEDTIFVTILLDVVEHLFV